MIRNIFGNGDAGEELKLVYFTHFSGEIFFSKIPDNYACIWTFSPSKTESLRFLSL